MNESTLFRLWDVIGDKKRGIRGTIPMSRTAWYAGITEGKYPAPVKLGRSSYWKAADIQALIERISA